MKVLLVNGSPHPKGSTYTALSEVAGALQKQGLETEILQIGAGQVRACIACGKCSQTHRCVFTDDVANEIMERMESSDALVVGTPVYYAGPNGALCAILDRVFYANSNAFAQKPGAAVAVCRRGGSSAALDRLNKYFTICEMPVVSSRYWNMAHGTGPEEVKRDEEGMNTMRTLGENIAYLLQCKEKAAIPYPKHEPKQATNFIR
ncbi:flavodoxin family protein [Ruminococcaceae bacterium OttesenSCG-928-I18]|nr:flavodoxin family protein [Ruminococcaceae bacterium OttesenSCG-928-I18]